LSGRDHGPMGDPVHASAGSGHAAEAISITGLRHGYGGRTVLSLERWSVCPGAHWLVLGASGSGKTTLPHLLAGLLMPQQGSVAISGQDLAALGSAERDRFRGRNLGIVSQRLHLVDCLTVLENLMLARYLAGLPENNAEAMQTLAALALADKADAYPTTLSYGQAQRAATVIASHDQWVKSRFEDRIVLMALGVAAITVVLLFTSQLEDRFAREAQGIKLVVGAKGSPLQLVLSSVYHPDVPTGMFYRMSDAVLVPR
jgi:predicted ABC-type transport system involved in lysophospholipase L1 biosynthesis ATPase subunit